MATGNKWNIDSIYVTEPVGAGIKDIKICHLTKEDRSIILTFEFFLCYKLSIPL
jgi:hypothetical protein